MFKLQHYDSALFTTMLLIPVIFEDTCITASFHSEWKFGSIKGFNQATLNCRNACTKQGEWRVMHICVCYGIDFFCPYYFLIIFWNCADGVVFICWSLYYITDNKYLLTYNCPVYRNLWSTVYLDQNATDILNHYTLNCSIHKKLIVLTRCRISHSIGIRYFI